MSAPSNGSDAISLWDTSAPPAPAYPPLDTDVETEVAIVGGGFTGSSTALHLAEKGIECCVLEAEGIGFGGSGRNVGLVNAGLWLPPQDVRRALGHGPGARFITLLGDAPAYVFSLIEHHQIQCEAARKGTIHAAHSAKGFEDLTRRAEEWDRLGAPVELLDADATRQKIGTDAFFGGLLDHRAGTINPMGYVRGLARAASNRGAVIHTGTKANRIVRDGARWKVETSGGAVSARYVVLGTNAYTDELWPGLARTFTLIHYFQVATEPLGDASATILPEGQGVWDTGTVMFSFRKDAGGRLLLGSMGKLIGGENGLSRHWAQRTLRRLFPQIQTPGWEKAWHGKIAMTSDHLPRIHRLAHGVFTPIGYNGRGITPGTIFGKAMADHLAGMPEDELPLPITPLREDPASGWKSALYELAFKGYRVYKSL